MRDLWQRRMAGLKETQEERGWIAPMSFGDWISPNLINCAHSLPSGRDRPSALSSLRTSDSKGLAPCSACRTQLLGALLCEMPCYSWGWNERDSQDSCGVPPSFNTKAPAMTSSLQAKAFHQGLMSTYTNHQLTLRTHKWTPYFTGCSSTVGNSNAQCDLMGDVPTN